MTRSHWKDIALGLASLRRQLDEHAERALSDRVFVAHRERALGVDLAVRALCRILRRQSARFNGREFMRTYTSAAATK